MTVELTKILTNYAVFAVIWYVLQTFGYFRLLRKTPANKVLAFIPVVRELVMFKLVWKSKFAGIVWFVCAIGGLALFLVSASTGCWLAWSCDDDCVYRNSYQEIS